MSTLEALNAISEAIQAHAKLPEVERSLKEAREAHDYALLELEEAKAQIEKLQAQLDNVRDDFRLSCNVVEKRNSEIHELRERNTSLDASLYDVTRLYNDSQHTIVERNLQIDSLKFTVDSLTERLGESKSYGYKLAETLKSIGASIVAAVEVPEVTSEAPFPVVNSVAMPDSPSDQSNDQSRSEPMEPVAEQARENLEPVINAPGCYTSPMPPVKHW